MGYFYRRRLPCWVQRFLCIIETSLLPILIFQLLRTIIWTTFLEISLLLLVGFLFLTFYLRWV